MSRAAQVPLHVRAQVPRLIRRGNCKSHCNPEFGIRIHFPRIRIRVPDPGFEIFVDPDLGFEIFPDTDPELDNLPNICVCFFYVK